MKYIIATVMSLALLASHGEDSKIASIKMKEDGRVKAESVALEEATNIVAAVFDELANATNVHEMAAFKDFAMKQRGDDTYRVDPQGISLVFFKEEGGSSTDPDTGAFHFSVERYWTNDVNSLVASVVDATFDTPDAVATWRLYLAGEGSGESSASATARLVDFHNGISATYNPVEVVVYSDEFNCATNAIWKKIKNISPQYVIRPHTRPDGKVSYIIYSDTQ